VIKRVWFTQEEWWETWVGNIRFKSSNLHTYR